MSNIVGNWMFKSPPAGPKGTRTYDTFSGNFVDTGGQSWLVVGTCSGHAAAGGAVSMPFNLQYDKQSDVLKWTAIDNMTHVFSDVSSQSTPVDIKVDVVNRSVVVLVKSDTKFGNTTWILQNGSYMTLGAQC